MTGPAPEKIKNWHVVLFSMLLSFVAFQAFTGDHSNGVDIAPSFFGLD